VSMSSSLAQLDPSPFTARLDLVAGRLEVAGHLDHRTAHLVHDAVSALAQAGSPTWLVDVRGLTGRDADCLRVLGGAYRRALRHGRQMTLTGASPSLQQALARLRLDHHLTPSTAD
jgi:anti-anti-sigma factor